MYNKTIIRFGFCDIQNQSLGKGYQPKPKAEVDEADDPYLPWVIMLCCCYLPTMGYHVMYDCSA